MDLKAHWQSVYTKKAPDEVSWYQAAPTVSVRMLEAAGLSQHT